MNSRLPSSGWGRNHNYETSPHLKVTVHTGLSPSRTGWWVVGWCWWLSSFLEAPGTGGQRYRVCPANPPNQKLASFVSPQIRGSPLQRQYGQKCCLSSSEALSSEKSRLGQNRTELFCVARSRQAGSSPCLPGHDSLSWFSQLQTKGKRQEGVVWILTGADNSGGQVELRSAGC